MVAIVYQINQKTGVTYAYESISCWDKVKQQSRAKRKCLGRVDPETKEIIPTLKRKAPISEKTRRRPVFIAKAARSFYGATYLFDRLGEDMGVVNDLQSCFPDSRRQILSPAYYLIMEDKNSLRRFPRRATALRHPHGEVIFSQRSSELFVRHL